MDKFKLEERLIDFAANIILFTNHVDKSYAGNHLVGQIVRSSICFKLWRSTKRRKQKRFYTQNGYLPKRIKRNF